MSPASEDATGSGESWAPLPGYRRSGLALLAAALVSFAAAALAALSARGTPLANALFWAAVALVVGCFFGMPLLLMAVLRVRGIVGLDRRLVLMRAIWGGPFGALGAIWDLTGTQRPRLR